MTDQFIFKTEEKNDSTASINDATFDINPFIYGSAGPLCETSSDTDIVYVITENIIVEESGDDINLREDGNGAFEVNGFISEDSSSFETISDFDYM